MQDLIQIHVSAIETAYANAEAAADTLPPGPVRDHAKRALKFSHRAAALSFQGFKAVTAGETDAVALSGPVEK
jgi:hypothetical protein